MLPHHSTFGNFAQGTKFTLNSSSIYLLSSGTCLYCQGQYVLTKSFANKKLLNWDFILLYPVNWLLFFHCYILWFCPCFDALWKMCYGLGECYSLFLKWRHKFKKQVILNVSVQSLSHVRLFVTPWIAARQASMSITNSQSSLRFTSIESVMPSSHLIRCCPLLLLPPIPPSIRVFSNESAPHMRWPSTGVSALASFLPKKSQGRSPLEWIGWISLQTFCSRIWELVS